MVALCALGDVCLLIAVRRLLCVVCCLLFGGCLLVGCDVSTLSLRVHGSLFAVRCVLFVACRLLCVVSRWLLVVCCCYVRCVVCVCCLPFVMSCE